MGMVHTEERRHLYLRGLRFYALMDLWLLRRSVLLDT